MLCVYAWWLTAKFQVYATRVLDVTPRAGYSPIVVIKQHPTESV